MSAVLPKVDSNNMGSDPLVCQFIKGRFQLRPPLPKFSSSWDVSLDVLRYIKSIGIYTSLSLRLLSMKLTIVLDLTAPDRSSDLVKRDLRFRTFFPEEV